MFCSSRDLDANFTNILNVVYNCRVCFIFAKLGTDISDRDQRRVKHLSARMILCQLALGKEIFSSLKEIANCQSRLARNRLKYRLDFTRVRFKDDADLQVLVTSIFSAVCHINWSSCSCSSGRSCIRRRCSRSCIGRAA